MFDQLGEQLVVTFRMALDQLLERAQFAHLALQDDVVLDARHDAIHDAAGLRRRRNRDRAPRSDRSHEPDANEHRAPHQNVVPRLMKNWKPGSLVNVVRHAAVAVAGHVPPL